VDADGRVGRIVHRELPGQREAADAFLRSVGVVGPSEPATMPPVTYRRLHADDDLDAITRLLHEAYAPLAAAGMRYVASHQDVATTRRRTAKGETFVAIRDDAVVGIITLAGANATHGSPWYERPDVASFGQFAVLPALQRQGIGSRLMDIVEARAREKGVMELALDTSEHAEALIAMYMMRGYRFIEYAKWDSVNYRSVILSKRLA
jgi:GNAT superfamily N-acetyltransferase